MKFCERPFKHAHLARDGEVWPCAWMHCTIGNLNEQSLGEMWHSEGAELARNSILNGSFAFCRGTSCPYLERNELPELSEEEIHKRAVVSETPEVIFICNDLICNIACTKCRTEIFCPDKEYREKIDRALESVLPYANRAKKLDMNGAGEFLANPSFLKFLNEMRPERKDCVFDFETNGVLFDEAHWAQFSHLSKYPINITVTLDSMRPEIYRYLSGGFDKCEQIKENLRFLSTLRRENKIKSLTLTMVVQECNFQEVPEYVRTFTQSEEYFVDRIILRPVYKWFHMTEETYWFKNILNPLHPYHQEYLKILADDCWKEPKVYDWGCHNLREAKPHPLSQEKVYNRLLMDIYQNKEGLAPVEYISACIERSGAKRIGFYGKNDFSRAIVQLLQQTGVNVAFQLTWADDAEGEIPKVSRQNFRPEMADMILLLDFYRGGYWLNDLPALGFQGTVLTIEELIEGKRQ